jgi:RNA polymerase sigma-70 factor (ECF subfamily)
MTAISRRRAAPNSNVHHGYRVENGERHPSPSTTRTLSIARGTGRPRRPLDSSVERASASSTDLVQFGGAGASTDESDAVLVARVRAGDVAAFSGLVHRHIRTAFGIAYHVLQHREDAEDAVQQAFMAALARLDTFDATRPFGPWMSRVVLNHARSARRARTRLVRGWIEPVETIETSPALGPDRFAERSEIRERVREAIALLPERQRLAVQLIDIEGYAPADVAAILELSPVTVRWHLMAARRKLRRLLAPLGTAGASSHGETAARKAGTVRRGSTDSKTAKRDGLAERVHDEREDDQ